MDRDYCSDSIWKRRARAPILIVDYIIKNAGRKAVKEALEEKVSPLQVTTRICPQSQRGVTEEAKFCPNCGKQL